MSGLSPDTPEPPLPDVSVDATETPLDPSGLPESPELPEPLEPESAPDPVSAAPPSEPETLVSLVPSDTDPEPEWSESAPAVSRPVPALPSGPLPVPSSCEERDGPLTGSMPPPELDP